MDIFRRIELKYRLTDHQYRELMRRIDPFIKEDLYFESTVLNIYFDTDQFDLIIRSLDKPEYKGKIRLRSYYTPGLDDEVFLELKFKYQGTVGKRRVMIRLRDYYAYLETVVWPECNRQIKEEIDYCFRFYGLQPRMKICYDRRCYCDKDNENFRITFDKNIRYSEADLHLAVGTGYIGYAALFTIVIALVILLLDVIHFGESTLDEKVLKIVIMEALDYTTAFDDLFSEYRTSYELMESKTTNMGSLFELSYMVVLKKSINEKEFLDKIRVINGNLRVSLSHPLTEGEL